MEQKNNQQAQGQMYLHNEKKRVSAFHFWDETTSNTACRMWATGGMKQSKPGWVLVSEPPHGKGVCLMCANAMGLQP